jgi:hypothetical protein
VQRAVAAAADFETQINENIVQRKCIAKLLLDLFAQCQLHSLSTEINLACRGIYFYTTRIAAFETQIWIFKYKLQIN